MALSLYPLNITQSNKNYERSKIIKIMLGPRMGVNLLGEGYQARPGA
jgi:hypothetical protein